MHLFLQMSKLQETTSYFDENAGRVGVKSDTVSWLVLVVLLRIFRTAQYTVLLMNGL